MESMLSGAWRRVRTSHSLSSERQWEWIYAWTLESEHLIATRGCMVEGTYTLMPANYYVRAACLPTPFKQKIQFFECRYGGIL